MSTPPEPRRVLLVEEAAETGGAVMSLETLIPDDPAASAYSYTVALGGKGRMVDRLQRRGIDVHVVPVQGWRWFEAPQASLKLAASTPLQIMSVARWMRFLRRQQFDLVHLNSNRLVEPLVAARSLRLPTVVHFRDIPSRMSPPFMPGLAAFYWLMNRANRWIANSRATEQDIRPHARVPVATVPNGLDVAGFDRRADAQTAPGRQPGLHVAMIALINPWKRYEHFIDVAEAVIRRRTDVRFSIAGAGNDGYVRQLQATSAARGLERHLTFAGHIENIPSFLGSVDILVHTADPEPFGRVFLEAMAARRPVVAFRSGGAAEIVVDGSTGLLVDPGDVSAMSEAVIRLLADPAMRQRFGSAGRRRVEACYSADRYRAGIAEQYEAALSAT